MKPLLAFLLLGLCLEPHASARWSARWTPEPLEAAAKRTMRELSQGPLQGRRLSVLVDVEAEKSVDVGNLLSSMGTEAYLTRTGGEDDPGPEAFEGELEDNLVEGEFIYENASREMIVAGSLVNFRCKEVLLQSARLSSLDGRGCRFFEKSQKSEWFTSSTYRTKLCLEDVLISLVDDEVPWPLLSPPPWWGPSAVIIISLSFQCQAVRVFQMKLVERTTWVTYLCPIRIPNDQPRFSVLSWLPFDPDQQLVSLGLWEPESFSTFSQLFIDRFKSMGGHTLNVASDDDDAPLLFLDENDEFEGTCKRILDALADTFNFTFTLTHGAPDLKWGEIENGTWVGLLGEVYRGRKDMAINYFTITHERAQYFDYSISYHTEGFGFALPKPPPLPQWRSLVYPFTWVVWVGVGVVLVFTGLAFFLLTYTQPVAPDVSLPGAFGIIMMDPNS
ncbi:uncharacterized protein LOC125032865 [Penaeus chinensis]|uniref:uncharacterized protein LOC125032865 n=1 Tax=Penaeus chinensis TaxID=139456 RepID=UPI001FB764A9|nr:uncharacterized protein LOC125032865 [Penaeus chinensis]